VTTDFRVVLWEQPVLEGVSAERTGWGEAGFDLSGATGVQEVIAWAEEQLAAGAGYWSRQNKPVRDREYVVYAKVPNEQTLIQIAGWDPHLNSASANLSRNADASPEA